MSSIIGNAIVVIILAIVIFLSGRSTIRMLKGELEGKGCSGCSGSCSGCSSCNCSTAKKK